MRAKILIHFLLWAHPKIIFFVINTRRKSNFYIERARGNRPNFVFGGSLITIFVNEII